MPWPRDFQAFRQRVQLMAVLDHSGRAGNGFFLTIFDQHPQVLTCHWVHYLYSYLVSRFGTNDSLPSKSAGDYVRQTSYFRYVLRDPDQELAAQMHKFGADPATPLDRELGRKVFDRLLDAGPVITRRDLVLAAYFALAAAAGRDPNAVRYILVSDAVSQRTEDVLRGFAGQVIDCMLRDFPEGKYVSLVRDPRANFASCRHQFVNSLGNMYGVGRGRLLAQVRDLHRMRLSTEGCVYLYWLTYFKSAADIIWKLKSRNKAVFRTVRNEDLNLRFVPTMERLCAWLEVDFNPVWRWDDYTPTTMGRPWKGTGAYNSRYQTNLHGPLANDPLAVALKVTGPNRYVTERWKSRLSPAEMGLIEILFRQEMEDLGYPLLQATQGDRSGRLLAWLLRPFKGELPRPSWLADGLRDSGRELGNRLLYTLFFPWFYVAGRAALWRLYRKGWFDNPEIIPGRTRMP